jgi:hypothetical protein
LLLPKRFQEARGFDLSSPFIFTGLMDDSFVPGTVNGLLVGLKAEEHQRAADLQNKLFKLTRFLKEVPSCQVNNVLLHISIIYHNYLLKNTPQAARLET